MATSNITGMSCDEVHIVEFGYLWPTCLSHNYWLYSPTAAHDHGQDEICALTQVREHILKLCQEVTRYEEWGGWKQELKAVQAVAQLKAEDHPRFRLVVSYYERLLRLTQSQRGV